MAGRDRLHEQAYTVIFERQRASAVVLQRGLGIGYPRAVAILDALTAEGKLGPDRPDGTREILASATMAPEPPAT